MNYNVRENAPLPERIAAMNISGVRTKPESARVGREYIFVSRFGQPVKATITEIIPSEDRKTVHITAVDNENLNKTFFFEYDDAEQPNPESNIMFTIGQAGGKRRRTKRSKSRRRKSRRN